MIKMYININCNSYQHLMNNTKYVYVYLEKNIRFKIVEGTRVRLPVAKKREDSYNDHARGSFSARINCFASKLSFRSRDSIRRFTVVSEKNKA